MEKNAMTSWKIKIFWHDKMNDHILPFFFKFKGNDICGRFIRNSFRWVQSHLIKLFLVKLIKYKVGQK